MQRHLTDIRFGDVHLDPANDPPEHYEAALDVFCVLWGRLQGLRELCGEDKVVLALIDHLQKELTTVTLVLRIKSCSP
jgi:hypothetical protein